MGKRGFCSSASAKISLSVVMFLLDLYMAEAQVQRCHAFLKYRSVLCDFTTGIGGITACNEVGARLCFYTCLWFCSRGVCPIEYWDTLPPWLEAGPPSDQAPPPPGADPWDQAPPGSRHPQDQAPPRTRHPPAQCMLGDTGNKRAVRILLECNLVVYRKILYHGVEVWPMPDSIITFRKNMCIRH